MKVTAVTPADAAQSPSHPDHDRWVKEKTLAMEVAHAERIGRTFRDAESENIRLLARMEALAKSPPPAAPTPRKSRAARNAERGVTVKHAGAVKPVKLSPCGRCGVCRNCKREKRFFLIMTKRKDDVYMKAMSDRLAEATLQAAGGVGIFMGLSARDRARALTAIVEAACDASISRFGEWR